MMSQGIFTISLDFELFWGVRDHRTLDSYGTNIRNVHKVVPRLLSLFEEYEVHCTWATVGFLFLNGKNELVASFPSSLPTYLRSEYDPYRYIQTSELDPVYHFAPHLIELIRHTKGQEIGTHTYSHFYTLEKNTTIDQFREDLKCAMHVARERGLPIKSIVFPRNQYSDQHVDVCRQAGIAVYRGNESSDYYKPASREDNSTWKRGIRMADTFFNITGHHCHPVPKAAEIINVPASRFLRPHNKKLSVLNGLKLRRITNSMRHAAKNGLIYQLWWHPHNFGRHMEENFVFLEKILKVYRNLAKAGKMRSLNLYEIYLHSRNQ